MEKILFCLALIIAMLLSSCGTTGTLGDTGIVTEYQRAVQRVEDTAACLGEFHNRVENRIDAIGKQAAGIGDAIERLEFSFNEYDRLVRELLDEVDRLRAEIESEK